jgi:hypothetical protein
MRTFAKFVEKGLVYRSQAPRALELRCADRARGG